MGFSERVGGGALTYWPARPRGRTTILVLASLLALTAGLSCSGGYEEGQVLDVVVTPEPGTPVAEGIMLDHVSVRVGILDEDAPHNPHSDEEYDAGDRCLLVSGRMRNITDEDLYVGYHVDGYTSEGEQVAWTLTSSYLPGAAQIQVPHDSSQDFEIVLSWTGDLRHVDVSGFSSDRLIPSSPGSPLDRYDESEITRIILSREWLRANDAAPDIGLYTITFPESWLLEPPEVPMCEVTAELAYPTEWLLEHNKSKTPGEIAVTIRSEYFTSHKRNYEPGQVLCITVAPAVGRPTFSGVLLEEASVRVWTLEEATENPWTAERYDKGARCLLVSGKMRNVTAEDLCVDLWLDGHNSWGKQVSWTLSSEDIRGHVQLDLPRGSSRDFEVLASWADDIHHMEMVSYRYDRHPGSTGGAS